MGPTRHSNLARVPRPCRVFCDRAGTLTLTIAEERPDGSYGGYRKSKSPPCVCKERRHKDGAPAGVNKMSDRVGQPRVGQPPTRLPWEHRTELLAENRCSHSDYQSQDGSYESRDDCGHHAKRRRHITSHGTMSKRPLSLSAETSLRYFLSRRQIAA